ncbi:hypothetical protein ED733_005795 [Metarhizium rileyi]|uniref:BZIP domain-containing protein n=1 Tax=Metarhizium rileyi (strain RCEF 4871) TaxID=1649241 RepID=A0A5C6GDU2_METRR|nr:hypothetical protein ED733_005795 [Metarhizium rileyi]
MTNYYPIAPGQGSNEAHGLSLSPNGPVQSQGLLFADTAASGAMNPMMGNNFLGHGTHANNFNFNTPQGNNPLAPQPAGAGFHPELHFAGGYLDSQAVSGVIPYQAAASMQTRAHAPAAPFASPAPGTGEQTEVRFEGFPLELVRLSIQDNGDAEELSRRRLAIEKNQEEHRKNPPVIPDHTLGDMSPKKVFPDFIKPVSSASPEDKLATERENNRLAAQLQKEDRARNNEAAKRSRLAKSEALANATSLNVTQSIRIAWLEVKVIGLGGDPAEFASVRPDMLDRLRERVLARMDAIYAQRKKNKAEEDSRKRAIRNKERQRKKAAANERYARQRAEASRAAAAASASASASASPDTQAQPTGMMMAQLNWNSVGTSFDFDQN